MNKSFFTFALAACAAFGAHAESTRLTVNGMVCAFCAQGIEAKLGALPQTQAVYVDLGRKVVAVEAKPGQKHDPEVLRSSVKDAGYEVVGLETVPQSVAEIRAQSKDAAK